MAKTRDYYILLNFMAYEKLETSKVETSKKYNDFLNSSLENM
jgi:hypothetical protein